MKNNLFLPPINQRQANFPRNHKPIKRAELKMTGKWFLVWISYDAVPFNDVPYDAPQFT